MALYRYIELNPVRANMVDDPADYKWSSYQINALDKVSDLCTPHEFYLKLGANKDDRQENYRALFIHSIDGELVTEIRNATKQGMALGNEQFKLEIEELTGRRMRVIKTGRPIKKK